MKLHWLQHVPFEGLGSIDRRAAAEGFDVSCTRLFAGDRLPGMDEFDLLVIMGGPMGIHDHGKFPWLIAEKEFIRAAIDAEKRLLGICLGAQLIADVLGAKVYPGENKEIGWFRVQRDPDAPAWIPEDLTTFHWHGDTFDIPDGAVRLASSDACRNQGFIYDDRVAALQFHLETTAESMEALIRNCGHELVDAPYIQSAEQMRLEHDRFAEINAAMKQLLNRLI